MVILDSRTLFLFALCFLLGRSEQNHRPLRIINGSIVDPSQLLPYQVLLILGSDPLYDLRFCGGALISEEWVVTSGKCAKGSKITDCEAYLGAYNISDPEDTGLQFSFVRDYDVNHSFDADSLAYNIALIRLTTPAVFNDFVKAIDLPIKNQSVSTLVGKTGTISGWGSTNVSDFDQLSYVLQTATTTILDDSNCTQSDIYLDLSSHICAKSDEDAHIFGSDFGGPLVVEDKLVGIGSVWTGVDEDPDLFTDVHLVLDWISEITGIPVN